MGIPLISWPASSLSLSLSLSFMDSTEEQLQGEVQQQEFKQEEEKKEHINKNNDDNYCHVLAVDDSLIDRKILEKLLTLSSFHVTCVESGDKALEYLGLVDHRDQELSLSLPSRLNGFNGCQAARINLILTDYSMPGITGYDLLKRVKGSSWKDVPVVVMSSENVPSRIHMCLEEGADEFLLKPVRLSDLKKLHPHLHKSTTSIDHQSCDQNNKKRSFFDKGKGKNIDDEHFDRRVKLEGFTASVNL